MEIKVMVWGGGSKGWEKAGDLSSLDKRKLLKNIHESKIPSVSLLFHGVVNQNVTETKVKGNLSSIKREIRRRTTKAHTHPLTHTQTQNHTHARTRTQTHIHTLVYT
jgi:hypothetical protein